MNTHGFGARMRTLAGIGAGAVLAGLATTIAPTAAAAPTDQCSAGGLAGTVSSVTGQARQYLDAHPGANSAVSAAMNQPFGQAEANLRGYFTANPAEYHDLRGILAPIGDAQRTCNVTVLPGQLATAYDLFMAG
ncbi:heme-binding protein [Mycobacterium sp. Y57]|uniref:heme-binding protein n=1 Tax=Mycolicibacterium xanthum TaxID=2796469 RepID=UPI001C85915D|nr:heme-binding protein [Mycolicibacterium xanthum]MBX7435162.1 heme-binding protein [Mycolicibacterium xanthum]